MATLVPQNLAANSLRLPEVQLKRLMERNNLTKEEAGSAKMIQKWTAASQEGKVISEP